MLTGDDRQLPSVEAGGGFGALGCELGATRLGANARQVAEWSAAALDALREGRAGEAAAAYSHHGRVHRSTNPSELIGDMVERWWAARESGHDAVLYAYARDVVRVLNGLARLHVEKAGRLLGPELVVEEFAPADLVPRTYRVGDELCSPAQPHAPRRRARPIGKGRAQRHPRHHPGDRPVVARGHTCDERRPQRAVARRLREALHRLRLRLDAAQRTGPDGRPGAAERRGEATRPRGRAFVFGAEGLSAEAALVAASRATDSTELFVLTEPNETANTGDGDESWAGRGAAASGSDSPSTSSRPELRSPASPELLGEMLNERDTLVSLVGAGPAVDLTTRQADATRELGISLVQRDEAQEEAGVFATMSATSEGVERRNLQGPYTAARRRLVHAERDVTEAAEVSEAANAASLPAVGARLVGR